MEQTRFYHRNFENSEIIKQSSKKKEILNVRIESQLLQDLVNNAEKAGIQFSEYVRRKLRDEAT